MDNDLKLDNKFLKDKGYLFSLPIEIEPIHQKQIVDFVVKNGFDAPLFNLKKNEPDIIWKSVVFRGIDINQLRNEFPSLAHVSYPGLQYVLRYRTDLHWNWIDSLVTGIVRQYAEKASKYIFNLSRVAVILLKPGSEISPHMDKVSGTRYGEKGEVYFHVDHNCALTENRFHQNNNYLSLKIPISEVVDDNGFPYLRVQDHDYFYNVKRNLFCINEAQICHGAKPCNFWRGIIYLDGNLNLQQLKADAMAAEIIEN